MNLHCLRAQDMENMLLVWEEEYRLINYRSCDSGVPVKQTVIEEGIHHALTVRNDRRGHRRLC